MGIDEKEILGSYSAAVDIQESAADLVLEKKLPVMEIVTHRFPLARIQEGTGARGASNGRVVEDSDHARMKTTTTKKSWKRR